MWFKLAGADFSKNNLGTMSSISSSYLIDYTGLTGMSGSPSSVSYAGSAAGTSKTASVVVTVTSGYTFKQGSTITASGGKEGTVFTADKDYTGGQTFTFSMAITANTKLSGTAEATGGSSGGNTGGSEGNDPVNPPSGDATWIEITNYVVKNTALDSNGSTMSEVSGVVRHNFTAGPGNYKASGAYSQGVGIVCFDASKRLTHFEPNSPFTDYEFTAPEGTVTIAVCGTSSITPKLYIKEGSVDSGGSGENPDVTIPTGAITPSSTKTGTYLNSAGNANVTNSSAIRYNYNDLSAGTYYASGYYPNDGSCIAVGTFTASGSFVQGYTPSNSTFTDVVVTLSEPGSISVAGSTSINPVLKKA